MLQAFSHGARSVWERPFAAPVPEFVLLPSASLLPSFCKNHASGTVTTERKNRRRMTNLHALVSQDHYHTASTHLLSDYTTICLNCYMHNIYFIQKGGVHGGCFEISLYPSFPNINANTEGWVYVRLTSFKLAHSSCADSSSFFSCWFSSSRLFPNRAARIRSSSFLCSSVCKESKSVLLFVRYISTTLLLQEYSKMCNRSNK